MAEQGYRLTIVPVKPSEIPSEELLLSLGKELLASSGSWKAGKTFHKKVKTYWSAKDTDQGAPWHSRVSEHTPEEATFDQLWDKLGKDKAINEKEFIPDIHKVTKVKDLSPNASIWTLHYKFPPPVSPRVFTVLQVTYLEDASPRSGYVISLPIDLSEDAELAKLEEKGVRGRYVSVERLSELENGNIEWRMATSSTPGGSIPTFIVESTMAGKIAEDVPHFLKWLQSLPPSTS
ncbi:hypothetical protein BDN72DRAFT_847807 [Pluteus cervinus]|uniref:Uncharacterized protein n=1 Tax=Pluteus cervinus TaxID=181527 RepID=A0ACD3AEG1_9AGAR|nr:hypothetical protein BDN72DRAFT_847807 [Pluteus cervinus]